MIFFLCELVLVAVVANNLGGGGVGWGRRTKLLTVACWSAGVFKYYFSYLTGRFAFLRFVSSFNVLFILKDHTILCRGNFYSHFPL